MASGPRQHAAHTEGFEYKSAAEQVLSRFWHGVVSSVTPLRRVVRWQIVVGDIRNRPRQRNNFLTLGSRAPWRSGALFRSRLPGDDASRSGELLSDSPQTSDRRRERTDRVKATGLLATTQSETTTLRRAVDRSRARRDNSECGAHNGNFAAQSKHSSKSTTAQSTPLFIGRLK